MPLTGPELGEGVALSIGVDLAMIFSTKWRSRSRLWPPPAVSDLSDADSTDSLASGKQLVAAGDQEACSGRYGGEPLKQRLGKLLDCPLLPTAALAGAAAACLGAAAASLGAAAGAGGWLLRGLAGYAAAEFGFQSYQCWR